jgi:hypothetical protein
MGFIVSAGLMISCGGSATTGSMTVSTTGTVNTSITDPPPGSFTTEFDSVYVTITKVTANISADADPNGSGWQTLVDLTSNPKQIDLLNLESTTCLLTQLGTASLPAGKYQQIRLYLLANNASTPPANDSCGGAGYNCVVPSGGSAQPLLLSSEAQTGIKIPSSQITSGGLTVDAGQSVDLNINFVTARSLVYQGNGQWRLKPVLHAGEVETNNSGLSGTVVDSATSAPIAGATVSLEQPSDSNPNIDTVVESATTDANGNFSFCGSDLSSDDTYDVVVTAMTGGATPVTYNPTVTLGVKVGDALGNIPLIAEPLQVGTTTTTSTPANIVGQVTTTVNSDTNSATSGDETAATITLTALQDVGGGKMVTIPPFSNMPATLSFTTVAAPTVDNGMSATTCPAGTNCQNYQLVLPASNPSIGTFTAGQATAYSAPANNPALYWVLATSVLPTDTTSEDCTPSSIPSTFVTGAGDPLQGYQIGVDPAPLPDNTVGQNFDFVACTAGQ